MKEKRVYVVFLVLAALVLISLVSAADNPDVEKSYTCLKNQLGDNCGGSTISTEVNAFNLLAMAYDSKVQGDCKSSLNTRKSTDCWGPSANSACDIKSTAQAIFALNNIGEKVDDSVNWLLGKRQSKTGLTWYLEIDSTNSTECVVNGRSFTINENKKLSGSDPAGLKKAYNNYWFEITDTDQNYTISCTSDFVTTLLYQKPGNPVFYVSSDSHTASASDSTTEKVESFCFSTSSQCDYEGTFWASLALGKEEEDISPYIPYLTAMSDEAANKRYFPEAFLYLLTNADDYYSQLLSMQKESKYWNVDKSRTYDTSLALLSLQGSNTNEVDSARKFLLGLKEGDTGCWNDVNMPFILYAGWPKVPVSVSTGQTIPQCENFGLYCTAISECKLEDQKENYNCIGGGDVCCGVQPLEQNCSDKTGFVCTQDQKCSGNEVQASDTPYCCIGGACQEIQPTENECEQAGYNCKDTCLTGSEEEKISYSKSCSFGQLCCAAKPVKSTNWLLILLLVILIILVILAILFRNQLKIWLFRVKSGFSSKKAPPPGSRPMAAPTGFRPMPPLRPSPEHLYQPQRGPPMQRRPIVKSEKDKDFEETMRKLRDMSK
ncbi:Uncharacterised protein [uncultured archaeon]|nr:Uncharacterised protein [uncultured archaeon]